CLSFITETEAHCERRPDFPVIAYEGPDIELTCGEGWIAGDDAELARAATGSRNLRPPILFNRSERKCSVKVLRCDAVVCLVAQPDTKAPTMPSPEHTHVILELVTGLSIKRMARGRRAPVERSEYLNCGTGGCWSDLVTGLGKLKADFVHHVFREHCR